MMKMHRGPNLSIWSNWKFRIPIVFTSELNNFAEAFHRKLQRQFSCTHPTIWRFTDTIRCEQNAKDADILRCVMGESAPQNKKKYRDADARIVRLIHVITTSITITSPKIITIMQMSM
ncbi:hypothetical protein niasHT_032330 [Heterodera trifolii]|uniref:Uncharacterized protein n=1 Tax=Heterodera trifolii TaxID=157864 RepID=A0ABD2HZV4_9BILA